MIYPAIKYGYKFEKSDERYKKFKKQRKKYGYDETELWSLDHTIACFVLPRLKTFKEHNGSHPTGMSLDEFNDILSQIIFSLEKIVEDKYWDCTGEDLEKLKNGLKLFGEHFLDLWD